MSREQILAAALSSTVGLDNKSGCTYSVKSTAVRHGDSLQSRGVYQSRNHPSNRTVFESLRSLDLALKGTATQGSAAHGK